ncbi:MAG: hypothetical protein O3A63_08585 [Proteobacteria bacterium]|nr:hypothetical protein [Pseudomonadota bacterium]
MIFNDKYLFLHYPKAAGKSLAVTMVKSWNGPVTAYISKGQISDLGPFILEGSTLYIEGAHQNALTARSLLRNRHQKDIFEFQAVFVAVRDPLDLICSTYFFLKNAHENGATRPAFELAASSSLDEFVRKFAPSDFSSWLSLEGKLLPNLKVIRCENMAEDFLKHASSLGFSASGIPHLNAGKAQNYSKLLTPELTELVREKYSTLYQLGLY